MLLISHCGGRAVTYQHRVVNVQTFVDLFSADKIIISGILNSQTRIYFSLPA